MDSKKQIIEPINATFEEMVDSVVSGQSIQQPQEDKMPHPYSWSKKLSRTDAQQKTSGGLVPYLRLTKGSLKGEDHQTWFRSDFFSGQSWHKATFGKEDIEQCKVAIEVTFSGIALGDMVFLVTHGADRWESHSAPNTWLHWPERLQSLLQKNDISARTARLSRDQNGTFSLVLGD